MEESQETVGVGSLVGVLGFPWEDDSNEGGKTFLLQMSAAEARVLFSWPIWAPGYKRGPPGRGSCAPLTERLVPKRLLAQAAAQTQPRCAGSFWRSSSCPACTAAGGVEESIIEKNAYR